MFQFIHHIINSSEESFLQKELKVYGFEMVSAKTLHKVVKQLDKESMNLITNTDAYYANRNLAWSITDTIIRKEKKYV